MARLDMGWHANPKILALPVVGMALHAWSISYCDATRSDGVIPEGAWPAKLAPGVKHLRAAHIYEPAPTGYYLHDYLDYNRSRAQIAEIGTLRAAAGRASGQAKREQRVEQSVEQKPSKPPSKTAANGQHFAEQRGTPGPGPGLTPGTDLSSYLPDHDDLPPGSDPVSRARRREAEELEGLRNWEQERRAIARSVAPRESP